MAADAMPGSERSHPRVAAPEGFMMGTVDRSHMTT